MSGSDLAPFVGAVLRDRIIDEMQKMITCTDYRNTRNNSDYRYRLCFDNGSSDDGSSDDLITDGFPLSSLNEIEKRLGGVAVQRFSIDNLNIHIDNDIYNEENPMEYIILQHIHRRHLYGPIACVDGLIGPLLWRRGQGHAGGDILL
ncbi:hypothetical protein FRACYDRAFT_245669 [Fragilariopsis cylindrus CCMP1102]|uniref:Uncharacterized protein n=1 Tax=Fragilariopsis cylindrus CCMP1102 TaxID=635003 RepID=A0A1E7EZU6_9STRA|nr:hypothetical protein FRACYDRAFT_245669 [Fragilariopsis cylindrus CCMP1102]|eukprot:OEU11344.1 hypothetical protein FRACYDRAFT_245669 [Fragilariopsis cylindrus CCMP1102]